MPSEAAFAEMCRFEEELELIEHAGSNVEEVTPSIVDFREAHG